MRETGVGTGTGMSVEEVFGSLGVGWDVARHRAGAGQNAVVLADRSVSKQIKPDLELSLSTPGGALSRPRGV